MISPELAQCKRNCWDYLKKYTEAFPFRDVNESELRVDIWRAEKDRIRIQLFGADNPNSIAGYFMDGCNLDEAQDQNPNLFGPIIRPLLSDRGGWAHWYGTARGKNYFWALRRRYREKMVKGDADYFETELKASQTNVISKRELDAAKEDMGDELYAQEYELNCEAPNKGSYYGAHIGQAEIEGRIRVVPYDSALPVDVWFDLGIDDTMSLWFVQQLNTEIRLIDYDEDSGLGIPEWCGRMRMKPYNYGRLYLPHDAAARELGTGRSREEIFRKQKFNNLKIVPKQTVADGIQAARSILSRCYFDRIKCEKGLDALKFYHREYDAKQKVFLSHPNHDWSSHASDAFRTGAMGMKEPEQKDLSKYRQAEVDDDGLS